MRASGLRLGKAAVLQDGRHESGFVLQQTAIYERWRDKPDTDISAVTATTVVLGRWRSR